MLFRKEEFDEVEVLHYYDIGPFRDAIKEIAKSNIIVDVQFAVNNYTYNALVLYRKRQSERPEATPRPSAGATSS